MQNVLHVRSKDASQLDDVYNTNFTVNLKQPLQAAANQEIHVSLISCEIPHCFYCISSYLKNNTIAYAESSVLTLPNQNYDIDELLRVINVDGEFPFTASYNAYSNKMKLTNNESTTQTIRWNSSLATKLLGFEDGIVNVPAGGHIESDNVVDLATVHSIFVRSDLSSGNVQSTSHGNSTILQKISVDCNPWNVIYFNAQDHVTTSVISKTVIDHITFRLTDQNDNLLHLNQVNYEFALKFEIVDRILKHDNVSEPTNPILAPQDLGGQSGTNELPPKEGEGSLDDTHAVRGKSQIEHVGEQIVIDALIDRLND